MRGKVRELSLHPLPARDRPVVGAPQRCARLSRCDHAGGSRPLDRPSARRGSCPQGTPEGSESRYRGVSSQRRLARAWATALHPWLEAGWGGSARSGATIRAGDLWALLSRDFGGADKSAYIGSCTDLGDIAPRGAPRAAHTATTLPAGAQLYGNPSPHLDCPLALTVEYYSASWCGYM
jgi:hypothetical protein